MQDVWRMDSEPSGDGGMILYGSPLYDEWHDAMHSVVRQGGHRTGGTKFHGDAWTTFIFPDQSRVKVRNDGAAVAQCTHKFSHRRRKNVA